MPVVMCVLDPVLSCCSNNNNNILNLETEVRRNNVSP